MASLGDLFVTVGAKLDGFKSAMGEVKGTLTSTGSDLKSLGTTLTAAVTVPLAGLAVASLKMAGGLEQNTIAFKTLLGSAQAASKHLADLRDFALKTPFQFQELTLASKRMQALGFEAKQIIPMLRNIGDAASALGMGSEGIQRITTALGQMQSKTKVQAEEMRQLAEAGIPAWQMLAKTLNMDVMSAMKAVEKRQIDASVAIPAILAGMNEKFGGLMEAQTGTLLGQWEKLKEQIGFTLMDIGNVLGPTAKMMMSEVFGPMLASLADLAKWFAQLAPGTQQFALGALALTAALGPLAVVLGQVIGAFGNIAGLVSKLPMLLNPVSAAILAVAAAAVVLYTEFDKLKEPFKETDENFHKFAASMVEMATDFDWTRKKLEEFRDKGLIGLREYNQLLEILDTRQQKAFSDDLQKQMKSYGITLVTTAAQAKLSAEEISKAFSALALKDLRKDLAEAEKAFRQLTAAGQLNAGQIIEAQDHIADLREKFARLNAGLSETKEKVNAIPFAEKSREGAMLAATIAALTSRTKETAKEIAESGKTEKKFFEDLKFFADASKDAWERMGSPPDWSFPVEKTTGALKELLELKAPEEYKRLSDAASDLGVNLNKTNIPKLVKDYEELEDAYLHNRIGIEALVQAYINLIKAKSAAGLASKEEIAWAKDLEKEQKEGMKTVRERISISQEFERASHRAFDGLSRDLAKNLLEWKGWGEAVKNVGRGLAEDLLSTMFKGFFHPLEERFAKLMEKLGAWLDKIMGVKGAPTTPGGGTSTVPGGGGGGGIGGGGGGIMGMVNMATGIGSLISNVVSNFQFAGMNKSLDVLVNHSLRTFNEIFQQRIDHWTQHNQTFLRLGEILNALQKGGPGGASITINNPVFGTGTTQAQVNIFMQNAFRDAMAARG